MTPQGWQCPLCKTVYAPHVDQCECASGERTFDVSADNADTPNQVNTGDPHKELREFLERMRELMERTCPQPPTDWGRWRQPFPYSPPSIFDPLLPPYRITCGNNTVSQGFDSTTWNKASTSS